MSDKQVKRVQKYEIYKTSGAFQFKLAPAYTIMDKSTGELKPKGCVFIDAAPAEAGRKYGFKDSDKKITFALSEVDIGQMLVGFKQGSFKLLHDPGAKTERQGSIIKTLSLAKGNLDNDGLPTFFLQLNEKKGEATKEVKIPLKAYEARILMELLAIAIPKILYWN
jgi:hypothetical protein